MHLQSRPTSLQSHGGCRPDDPAAHLGDHQGGGDDGDDDDDDDDDDDLCIFTTNEGMILIFQLI